MRHPFGLNTFCAIRQHGQWAEIQSEHDLCTAILAIQSHVGVKPTLCTLPDENSGELSPLERQSQTKIEILTGLSS